MSQRLSGDGDGDRAGELGAVPHAGSVESVRMDARARGSGQVFQVVGGTQYVVQHQHHHQRGGGVPLGLPELRIWIDRLVRDYRVHVGAQRGRGGRRQLEALQREFGGAAGAGRRDGKERVRRLVAAGAVQYLQEAARVPSEPLPVVVMADVAVFALWPVVQAPDLPPDWQDQLAELTTPRLAALVAQARASAAEGRPVAVDAFARVLADKPFAHGILALLEDLADPRGAGACLTALALAARVPAPPRKAPRALLGWLLGVGTGAVAGGAAADPDLVARIWEWMDEEGVQKRSGYEGDPDHPVDLGWGGEREDEERDGHRGDGGRHPLLPGRAPRAGSDGSVDDLFG
ncbi:hypothetical protein [Streptomyces antimicrobicus]|uniref:Uncharacterized protein n=1 Tax=Streptomyces antimicrobicus TaxID=2883108 RepID=A0ABS8B7G1_9ACTN|nr:hypothetical protein [Streptomyces antimicrobicus]MCB5180555.1 hypothetical protein [Streptomyces antimicrobicus]